MKQYTGIYGIDIGNMDNQDIAIRAELVKQNTIEQEKLNMLQKQLRQEQEYYDSLKKQQLEEQRNDEYRRLCSEINVSYETVYMFIDLITTYKSDARYTSYKTFKPIYEKLIELSTQKEYINNLKKELNPIMFISNYEKYKEIKTLINSLTIKLSKDLNLIGGNINKLKSSNYYKDILQNEEKQFEELFKEQEKLTYEFNEFRKHNYNEDMEILFRKLNANIDKIKLNEISKKGTIEDYIEYMNKKILEN